MGQALRPYVTTGIAIVGASLIAVTPVAPPPPNVQQRALKLVDYTEYDASQLASATEANWSGLETILSSSNWTTDPDISQGLSTLFSDLSTGTSNAVTNPLSVLTEGALALFSGDYGFNAASTAFTAVTDNIESALSSGDYSLALTDFENEGTTVLYAFLNGYPDSVGSGLISPEFGLLTNTTDGAATGQIDALAQISNTIADEVANLGGANLTTGSLPLVTGNLDLSVNLDQILSDLGLTSGGSALTINGLLGDLGISPTSDILPTLTIGDVLSDLKLTDSSGITLNQILEDLGVISSGDTDPTINIETLASEIFTDLNIPTSINLDTLATDIFDGLGISTSFNLETLANDLFTDLGIPTSINLDTLATDIFDGLGISTSFNLETLANDLFTDLGIPTSINVQALANDILGDLGTSAINTRTLATDLLEDLGAPSSITIGVKIPLSTIVGDLFPSSSTVSADGIVDDVLNALGITTSSGSISLDQILSALGVGSSSNDSLTNILSDLGLSSGSTITLDDILGDLGLGSTSTDSLTNILADLGLSSGSTITLDDILGDLGLGSTSTDSLTNILADLGLSSGSTITLDDILGDLGLGSTSSIDLDDVLTDLGFPANGGITLGDVLGLLHLSDSSAIPLPSLSIDGILGDLGINPDENILTLLGISDPLSLNPSIDLDGGAVATYADDLAKDLLAVLGSIEPASADLPSLLTTEPAVDLTNLLSGLLTGLDVPVSVSGNLSLDLTSVVAELVPSLF